MSKALRVSRGWVAVGALAAAAMAVPAASASAATNTVCSAAGLPSTTTNIPIDGIAHVTLTTCDAAILPPIPGCTNTITVPGVLHVTLFVCLPGTQAGPNSPSSPAPGTTTGVSGLVAGSMGPGPGTP